MRVWPFLLLALAACCPAPLAPQPTAFRATVSGTSPEFDVLHLQRQPGAPLLTLELPEGGLRSAAGAPLAVAALRAGDSVYVQGVLEAGVVRATEVRRLE